LLLLALNQIHHKRTFASAPDAIWEIRSVDTMKTSRDMARAELFNSAYDTQIEKQVKIIKGLGANYVAIGTPYDNEFLPYLMRWVKIARDNDLNVWYRGSFSGYEGWFEYPKSMSPDQLLVNTEKFIQENPDLFEDGDIFDPCPECENGGHWPQPEKDKNYEAFLIKKHQVLADSFAEIDKDVIYNLNSIIGGRAKEVVTKKTINGLGNNIALDHYAPSVSSYSDYIDHFRNLDSQVVFSEFGAPIPDMHGSMSEDEQAEFVRQVFDEMYSQKDIVRGVNYWVLNVGTTSLVNNDLSERKAAQVVQNYFIPGIINGVVKNTAGDNLNDIRIETKDGKNLVHTNESGFYQIVIPAGKVDLIVSSPDFNSKTFNTELKNNQEISENFILEPVKKDFIYDLRLRFRRFFN